jgi:hypothetical protein
VRDVSAIAELRKVAFWADALTETEAARALKGISERRFTAGGYICHRGDKLDYWIGIISGLLKISAISADGKAITMWTSFPASRDEGIPKGQTRAGDGGEKLLSIAEYSYSVCPKSR